MNEVQSQFKVGKESTTQPRVLGRRARDKMMPAQTGGDVYFFDVGLTVKT